MHCIVVHFRVNAQTLRASGVLVVFFLHSRATFSNMFMREVEGETWLTHWKLPETFSLSPPDGDYRDHLPARPEHIAEQYEPVVKVTSLHFTFYCCSIIF